jgi:maleate isomerase
MDSVNCKKVGFIVPSSNTAVEPITQAIFHSLKGRVNCIFTRIQVKTVGTDARSTSQFATETMVNAAKLLADGEPDAILWNGTSGQWTGASLEDDRKLAKTMQEATGIPCSTTTIAMIEALDFLKLKGISIAVPYTEALTAKVVEFYQGCGYEVVRAERMDPSPPSNLDIARCTADEMASVIERSGNGSDGVVVACTNWPAAELVVRLEDKMNIPIIDSITATAWWGLRMIGCEGRIDEWGRLMAL